MRVGPLIFRSLLLYLRIAVNVKLEYGLLSFFHSVSLILISVWIQYPICNGPSAISEAHTDPSSECLFYNSTLESVSHLDYNDERHFLDAMSSPSAPGVSQTSSTPSPFQFTVSTWEFPSVACSSRAATVGSLESDKHVCDYNGCGKIFRQIGNLRYVLNPRSVSPSSGY
jgi:hypothetical protein